VHTRGQLRRVDLRADHVVGAGAEGADHVVRVRHDDGAHRAAEPRELRKRDDGEVGRAAVDDLEAGGRECRSDPAGERRVDDDAYRHVCHGAVGSYETPGIGGDLSELTAGSQIFAPPILAG
jgi:hypothetical protein